MGSALPGMMQITLAMRSVADHDRRPLYQCLPAMRCTRENNDKHSKRSVGISVASYALLEMEWWASTREERGLLISIAGRHAMRGDGRSLLDRMISPPACCPSDIFDRLPRKSSAGQKFMTELPHSLSWGGDEMKAQISQFEAHASSLLLV